MLGWVGWGGGWVKEEANTNRPTWKEEGGGDKVKILALDVASHV